MNCSAATQSLKGFSLTEVLVAVGIMAATVCLVMYGIAGSQHTAHAANVENHCSVLLPLCLREIAASQRGESEIFANSQGEEFPVLGQHCSIAFDAGGNLIGAIADHDFSKGLREISGRQVAVIAKIHRLPSGNPLPGMSPSVLKISLEYPAGSSEAKRAKMSFFTTDFR